MARILVVDDEVGIRELLSEILLDEGHDVVLAANAAAARHERHSARPDLVLLDIWMPDTDGVTLLKEWAAGGQLTMPVVMMSGHGTIDTAVEATRIGAQDFLEKPISLQKLLSAVKRALAQAPAQLGGELTLAAFARSALLRDLRKRLEQMAAGSRVILLKSRPAGSGLADLCAHSLRPAGKGLLDLAEQTGMLEAKVLETTRDGVLFVPELAQLSRTQQKNLAFALAGLEKYGQHLLVATSHSQEELAALGWDENLLARLHQAWLLLPTLADLRDDVPEISGQILAQLVATEQVPERRLTTAAMNALRNRDWPGGYGELQGTVRSLALSALEEEIGEEDVRRLLAPEIRPADTGADAAGSVLPLDLPLREAREAFERLYFEHHLRLDGNMARLAEKAGLERTHLYRKLKALGLDVGKRD
ncbi:MAG: response regulator [Rhodocyclaceae bacterium]|nr:response regulator [Rhodocyclaceae bacterium]